MPPAGGRTAPGVAEMLAEQGKQVELVTPAVGMMDPLGIYNELSAVFARLGELEVKNTPHHLVFSIEGSKVTLINVFTKQPRSVEVDSVVLITHKYVNNEIYLALKEKGVKAHLIGDAVAPRFILNAVRDGHSLGREI